MSFKSNIFIAIEGGSASGKTTLAALLERKYSASVFHMDDYFLSAAQRTAERLASPGGNVDYERFALEVIDGLKSGKPFEYRPFDCALMCLKAPKSACLRRINIIEGAYSMHPYFGNNLYDITVFLEIPPYEQAARILSRNGKAAAAQFAERWIPMEKQYFLAFDIKQRCDFVF